MGFKPGPLIGIGAIVGMVAVSLAAGTLAAIINLRQHTPKGHER